MTIRPIRKWKLSSAGPLVRDALTLLSGCAMICLFAPASANAEPPPLDAAPPPPADAQRFVPLAVLAAQAAPTPVATPTSDATAVRVGRGDRVKVTVYNGEKLSGEYLVDTDGRIAMPMIGRIEIVGLTAEEAGARITARLADGYLINPSVIVDHVAFRDVYILGEVQRPGAYPYKPGLTIYQLVAQAGGFSYRASKRTARVRDADSGEDRKLRINPGSLVRAGDTVIILERFF